MASAIGYDELVSMLRGAVDQINRNHETLSQLDSFGGDGDHGTTMVRAMKCLEKAIAEDESREVKSLLQGVGWAIMGVDGGATGPLLGTLFMSMSDAAPAAAADVPALAAMFEAGLAGVRRQTKAKVGDKTVLDALVPAVEALRSAAAAGSDVPGALRQAAEAALQGAVSTKELQARYGRARSLNEKSIGAQDPGATSISYIFRGFAEGV